jgi:hypothetical protein
MAILLSSSNLLYFDPFIFWKMRNYSVEVIWVILLRFLIDAMLNRIIIQVKHLVKSYTYTYCTRYPTVP